MKCSKNNSSFPGLTPFPFSQPPYNSPELSILLTPLHHVHFGDLSMVSSEFPRDFLNYEFISGSPYGHFNRILLGKILCPF
jgi:hypothetical protein